MARFLLSLRSWFCAALGVATLVAAVAVPAAHAEGPRVAVAANFAEAVKEIGSRFEAATGHRPVFSFGATGLLYTQIVQGAPFEVFLAADQATPKKAIDDGFAVAESSFTYATGKLVLFSRDRNRVRGADTLNGSDFHRIAIANPALAPYGAAAIAAMKALGVYDRLQPKLVQGNNIAQTYQFVHTGNAELGFVALAQVALHDLGSRWIVPEALYPVVAQDAVLLAHGAESGPARAFMAFLKGPEARAAIRRYGYGTAN